MVPQPEGGNSGVDNNGTQEVTYTLLLGLTRNYQSKFTLPHIPSMLIKPQSGQLFSQRHF